MGDSTYKRSFAGSVGSGMKSLFMSEGRRFYSLEHKVSSKYHQAGEFQQIIVDEIELGRDSSCQVRFDDSFETVSRHHAAIIKDGNNWKLVQLSKTNSTYLNGHKVEKEWYLQNGDEIQLSTNGPKLGFIVPPGEKSLVKSIGLTARFNLFRQQALRPYKQALAALSCVLVLALALGCYFLITDRKEIARLNLESKQLIESIEREKNETAHTIDSLKAINSSLLVDARRREVEFRKLKNRVDHVESRPVSHVANTSIDNAAIERCLPNIFYIETVKFVITFPDGSISELACSESDVPSWCGTGFLLSDGRFVTARHVAEAWYFWKDGSGTNEKLAMLNMIANNGGKVVCHFTAISSSGKQLSFTSDQFSCNRSGDYSGTAEDGNRITLAPLDKHDYAYFRAGSSDGLPFDSSKSSNLERGMRLTVLGFPLGLGANSATDINPIYGSGIVAAPGLQHGVILTTDTNYEQGNSGGPVFYTNAEGKLIVIGIVSAGAGRSTGFVVPISAIH